MTHEDALGPAQAGVRLEREAAKRREDDGPTPPPQLVPGEIDGQRHDRDRGEHQPHVDTAVRGEGADSQEGGDRGQRHPDLLGDHQGGKDQDAVVLEKLQAVGGVHALSRLPVLVEMENRFRGIPRRADADRVVAEIIGAGGRGIAVQADVARPADVTRLFAEG